MARDTSKLVTIPGELHSAATGNIVAASEEIFDYAVNKYQKDINQEVASSIQDLRSTVGYYICSTAGNTAEKVIDASGYTLLKGGGLRVNFTEKNTAANATLNIEQTGAKPLYYNGVRVSTNNSWYAGEIMTLFYDGAAFHLNSLPDLDEYDVSARNGGQAFTFEEAVALVPEAYRHGGLKLRFISNSDSSISGNKYVQYRLMNQNWSTVVTDWQGVDDVPTTGNDNLVKSGGVADSINNLEQRIGEKLTDVDEKISTINLRNYPFSTNNEVNKYIKEVYVPSLPSGFVKGFISIRIGIKASYTGLYFNMVRLGKDSSVYVEILLEKGFASIEDAVSAATNYHIESTEEGAYCVVDFSSLSSAFDKTFELEHYDVEKLYNSPTIAQLILDNTNDKINSNKETINSIIAEDHVFSTNKDLNELIKEVYVTSEKPLGEIIDIRIAQLIPSLNKYYNGVMCDDSFIFYDAQYTTEQEAISAAQAYSGILEYEGDYLIVDFSKITEPLYKVYKASFKDLTKLYNSPRIEEYLHDKEVSNIKEDISEISVLETIEPIVVGIQYGEIASNGKISIGTSGTYKISEKINISKGDIIKIVGSGYNTLMIAEYMANGEPTPLSFIGGTTCENRVVKEYTYTCQGNGYVLLCWASVYAEVETYTHIKAGKLNALNYKIEASNILNKPNKPLNILIFGDSISDSANIEVSEESLSAVTTSYSLPYNGNSFVVNGETIRYSMWPALLRRLFNVFDIRCYARYGATYINDNRNEIFRQNLSEQIALALNDLSNPNGVFITNGSFEPDIVIFALSANDSNTPTDTYEIAMGKTIMSEDGNSFDVDSTLANLDLTQFNQAVRYAFLKMKRQFPYAIFFVIVPPQRSAYDIGETQKEKDLRRMAERYSIQIIDAAATCGILRDLEIQGSVDVYSKDGLHPNNKGQNLYARMVANAIKNNLVDMTLLNEW